MTLFSWLFQASLSHSLLFHVIKQMTERGEEEERVRKRDRGGRREAENVEPEEEEGREGKRMRNRDRGEKREGV